MTTRADNAKLVAELRADGMAVKEIIAATGMGRSYVYELINDPDGERVAARKRSYQGECTECGAPTNGSNGPNRQPPVCRSCQGRYYSIWTREAIVLAIQEWADDHGGIPPAANDFNRGRARDDDVPSVNHVVGRFGSWNAAIIAAGFEPHARGPVGGYRRLTADELTEIERRYAAGESSPRIAADIGCSCTSVINAARRLGLAIRPSFADRRAA